MLMEYSAESVARKQWTHRAKKMMTDGKPKKAILEAMLQSNWPEPEALKFISRIVWMCRLKWLAAMLLCALLALGLVAYNIAAPDIAASVGDDYYYVFFFPLVACCVGGLYALVKFIKACI